MRMDLVDDIIAVSDKHAHETAVDLAHHEGIFCGTSSGVNVYAAIQVAGKLQRKQKVVTIIVDTGLKYLGG
jgi:cysteine synthase